MKIILLRDVAKLGKRNSITEVPDGFALNKLIPQGLAMPATPVNLKRMQVQTNQVEQTHASELESFQKSLDTLKEVTVPVLVEANAQDTLFKSIKTSDVAAALAAYGCAVPISAISLPEPIKSLGLFVIPLIMETVSGNVTIEVKRK